MSLDFHVASARNDAPLGSPVFSLGVHEHGVLFGLVNSLPDYPQLRRMNDYYSEVVYAGAELDALVRELDSVTSRFISEPQIGTSLHRFRDVCNQASLQGMAVYGIAD